MRRFFFAIVMVITFIGLPQAAYAARIPTGNGVIVDVPPGTYVQAGHVETVDTSDGSIWQADGCWTFLPDGGKIASGVYAPKKSELFPGELTTPCEWTKVDVLSADGSAQATSDSTPAPPPQGPPPPQRRLLPKTGGFIAKGEMVDAVTYLFTDNTYVPDGPCYMVVNPKDGWGYDGVAWPWPKELDNKKPCPPPIDLPSSQPHLAQVNQAQPPPPPPPMSVQTSNADINPSCPDLNTVNCKPRRYGSIPFTAGEAVFASRIKLKTGRETGNCYMKETPSDGTMVDGVVNPWLKELRDRAVDPTKSTC